MGGFWDLGLGGATAKFSFRGLKITAVTAARLCEYTDADLRVLPE